MYCIQHLVLENESPEQLDLLLPPPLEEEEEDGNTDGGLKEWSVGKIAT